MPGEGMKEPSRKMTRMPRVKRSLFLKSGVLKALRIAPIKRPPRWRMKSQSRGRDLANETNTSKTLSGYDPQVEPDEGRRRLGSGRPPGTAGRGRVTQKGAVTEVTAPLRSEASFPQRGRRSGFGGASACGLDLLGRRAGELVRSDIQGHGD